ncbi:MAG: carboxypeptidase-like regulatory domain-containing protein, partial [Prevotellaceae bacterium]|nr:carboxypeptidase-like regulatory domain-containing protein [Prevotellaceae bacterium]
MNLIYHKKAGLLLILFMLSIGLYGQSKKITLNYQNTQLNVVLKDIEMQVDKSFFYDGDLIKDVNTPVSISVKDASLDKIIDLLFNQELAVFETSQHLVLLKKQAVLNTANVAAVTALSQAGVAARSDVINTVRITHNLRGTVLDQDGLPLVGALVAVKGNTRKFAFADIDGKFELTDVDANSVLTITYMGYKTMEEAVGNRNTINITLAQEVNVLQDVVVTGYQSLSKERSAGAFGTIEGSGIKDKAVLSGNILSSMDGLVTGLSVNNSDGVDKFLIRGITSINSTRSPLFVVDGVPMMENIVEDLINANDIASISVLKDATAASIWGSQAGNGVVVISTKKGQRNQALKITYDGSFSFIGKPDYGYQNKMSGEMFMKNAIELFDAYSQVWDYNRVKTSNQGLGSGLPIVFPHEVPLYRHAAGEISATERDAALAQLIAQNGRHSFEDNFMSNKLFTQHSLIFNGGGEKHTYYVSVNYRGDQGSYKDWSNRIGINSYQEMQLTKWMKWDAGVNASYSNQDAQILPWRPRGQWSIYSSSQTYQRDFPYMQYGVGQDHSQYYIYQNERARYEVPSGINMEFNP